MDSNHESIAVIVNAGGAVLDDRALDDMPLGRVIEADFAVAELATCVAVRLAHDCPRERLVSELRSWASARGWSMAVAPVRGSG